MISFQKFVRSNYTYAIYNTLLGKLDLKLPQGYKETTCQRMANKRSTLETEQNGMCTLCDEEELKFTFCPTVESCFAERKNVSTAITLPIGNLSKLSH